MNQYSIDPHLRFWRFHNRHIKISLSNGKTVSGVVVDTLDWMRKRVHTQYAFIASENRLEWLEADRNGDVEKRKTFEKVFDIRNVANAKLIR